jgi:hypothetical protein
MTKVFFGGSRKLSRLNDAIRKRTDNIIDNGFLVLLGDANGADKAMQKYLAERHYRNVLVFCMGSQCRNNLGNWETRKIKSEREKKDFSYYSTKDIAMSDEADYGFMLWDGESKGTLNNILNLLERGKQVVVYFSPIRSFMTLKAVSDVKGLLERCPSDMIAGLERTLNIQRRVEASQSQLNLA